MLKRIRRTTMFSALISMLIGLALLANFTAPNPTGRRYSSEMPVTTGQGNSNQIGISAERVLSKDLSVPRNDDPDQLQCLCSSPSVTPPLNQCRSCMAFAPLTSDGGYRRPDFVATGFIAESKNVQNLLYSQADRVDQIGDYVIGSRTLDLPLWLYTRVNTTLSPEFYRMVESTGGGVVSYFTVPGYVDPVDAVAAKVVVVSSVLLAITLVWEFGLLRRPRTIPATPEPKPRRPPVDPLRDAESFAARNKEKHRIQIDIEDSRSQ